MSEDLIAQAEAGDRAAQAMVTATLAQRDGRHKDALDLFAMAARLGRVDALLGAATEARRLGYTHMSRYFDAQAAHAGSAQGMFNLGVAAANDDEVDEAARWFQAAADAGDPDAVDALAKLDRR